MPLAMASAAEAWRMRKARASGTRAGPDSEDLGVMLDLCASGSSARRLHPAERSVPQACANACATWSMVNGLVSQRRRPEAGRSRVSRLGE